MSQFTLYHVLKGNKLDFHQAMAGEDSKSFYEKFLSEMRKAHPGGAHRIQDGRFGAMMDVNIVNDGPVTLTLESEPKKSGEAKEELAQL